MPCLGRKRIGDDDFVLVDWGANEGLYNSDLTRVLITGESRRNWNGYIRLCWRPRSGRFAAVRPGVSGHDRGQRGPRLITKAGFGRRFRHGLGHGLGLLVHEGPRLAVKQQTVLRPGMVVTVEPGIYLPGWGGVASKTTCW